MKVGNICDGDMCRFSVTTRHPWPDKNQRVLVQRDELLLTIYPRQGCSNLAIPVAWRIFRRHRNPKTLDVLIAFLGESERENVIAEEAAKLLASPQFIPDNAQFLLQVGSLDDAEQYVLTHAAAINGDYYWGLQDLAEEFYRQQIATLPPA